MTTEPTKDTRLMRQKVVIVFLILLALVIVTLWSSDMTHVTDWIESLRRMLTQTGFWAPLLYGIVYIVVGLTGFSVTVLSVVALGLFAPITAFFVIVLSATVSAWLAFMLARKSSMKLRLNKQIIPVQYIRNVTDYIAKKVEQQASSHSFRLVLLLRFSRLPYIVLSYAAGLLPSISVRSFVAATAITNILAAAFYVLIGIAVAAYLGGVFLVVVVVILVVMFYKRQSQSKNRESRKVVQKKRE